MIFVIQRGKVVVTLFTCTSTFSFFCNPSRVLKMFNLFTFSLAFFFLPSHKTTNLAVNDSRCDCQWRINHLRFSCLSKKKHEKTFDFCWQSVKAESKMQMHRNYINLTAPWWWICVCGLQLCISYVALGHVRGVWCIGTLTQFSTFKNFHGAVKVTLM